MSRTTQYVGLNKKAMDYVSELVELSPDNHTTGMFGEEISLRKWELPRKWKNNRAGECLREVEQVSPWSSGPVILTCLELDYGNGAKSKVLEWVADPTLENEGIETDYESGTYWI